MSGREPDETQDDADFLLEADDSEDIEEAFREALEAVEKQEGGNGSANAEPTTAAPSTDEPVAAAPERRTAAPGLEEELEETRNRLVRTLADFDNFRKRTERERSDRRRFEGFEILRDFLAIVDNLERALTSEGSADDLKRGLALILRQIQDLFGRAGVERIETTGQPFDPRVHEAIMRQEDADVVEPTVGEEYQAGYAMNDRLLRAARVEVRMPPENATNGEPTA